MYTQEQIQTVKQAMSQASSIAVLTGAGVSAESGVPTFRGKDGYWNGLRPEDLSSPEGFYSNPTMVWEWYNLRRRVLAETQPNAGHLALAQMAKAYPQFTLITQNVDRLHQAGGSENVLELHGNIWDVVCKKCNITHNKYKVEMPSEPRCEKCGYWTRPAVVWFGESLPEGAMETAAARAHSCDVFLVVGTSAVVYPAAGLIEVAKGGGAFVVEINIDRTPATGLCDVSLVGPSAEILPLL